MKNPKQIFIFVCLLLASSACCFSASTEKQAQREYKIKAAFLYNFFKTAEWPATKSTDSGTMTIGIIGENPFGDAFKPIKNQTVKNHTLMIKYFCGFSSLHKTEDGKPDTTDYDVESLQKCHVLFICSSEIDTYKEILTILENHSVLTVSEVDGFLENGGMINFVPRATKGEFEVNLITLTKAELKISSKILRIARRVIKDDD